MRWIGMGLAMAIGLGTGAIAQTPPAPGGGKAPKPSFFEESRRPSRTGFSETFVTDALDGMADPLGGRSATGSGAPNSNGASATRVRSGDTAPTNPNQPVAPGLPPGFDRTTVIIRR